MQILRHYKDFPRHLKGSAIAIGNFDGLHEGHRGVINETTNIAKALNVPRGVITFEPHPRTFFNPKQLNFRITPFKIKIRTIESLGVDFTLVLQFNHAISNLTAEEFIQYVLATGLNVRHVVCGNDFSFGKNRAGNCKLLLNKGKSLGFGLTAVKSINDGNNLVYSSTRIRNLLSEGNVKEAAVLLGRPFEIIGRVRQGDQRGREIGFPTANISLKEYIAIAFGVYAVRALIQNSNGTPIKWLSGVANFGIRPTFKISDPVLEVFLFNFEGNLYGTSLRIQIIEFIRPEYKFSSLDQLKVQIKKDCYDAKRILKTSY